MTNCTTPAPAVADAAAHRPRRLSLALIYRYLNDGLSVEHIARTHKIDAHRLRRLLQACQARELLGVS
jgi:DNA-binding transcriptional MocR family regulator